MKFTNFVYGRYSLILDYFTKIISIEVLFGLVFHIPDLKKLMSMKQKNKVNITIPN